MMQLLLFIIFLLKKSVVFNISTRLNSFDHCNILEYLSNTFCFPYIYYDFFFNYHLCIFYYLLVWYAENMMFWKYLGCYSYYYFICSDVWWALYFVVLFFCLIYCTYAWYICIVCLPCWYFIPSYIFICLFIILLNYTLTRVENRTNSWYIFEFWYFVDV